ncbi:12356_t:CDS:2 [Entrophospora sp. SA101]|nr:12356_t:CDS:2 [Entrophospora sp. SA101]
MVGVLAEYCEYKLGVLIALSTGSFTLKTIEKARKSKYNIILTDIEHIYSDLVQFVNSLPECQQIKSFDNNIRLRRKAEQDLLECHNEKGLLEFNRDRLMNELEIAEDDIIDQNQIINNLNQEILLLQNNIHINNNRTAAGINIAVGHADGIRIHGLFETCLKANLGAVQGQTAAQLGAQVLNRANGLNGNIIIPTHIIFDEDWFYVDGRPTDLLFGTTIQGSDSVGHFYSKLRKLARLAGIDEQQIRLQFLRVLSLNNQLEVRRIGINRSISDLRTQLEEIESYGAYLHSTSNSILTKNSRNKDNFSDNTDKSSQIHERKLLRPNQMELGKIYHRPELRLNDQEYMRMDDALDRLRNENDSRNEADSDEELSNCMSKLSINKAISQGIVAGVNAVKKSSHHRCSNCNKTGHNSCNCPSKKRKSKSKSKKKAKVNMTTIEPSSDSSNFENYRIRWGRGNIR